MPSSEMMDRKYLFEQRIEEYGILSLTKNALSYDMWSRYANGHKGFLIEFAPAFNKNSMFSPKDGDSEEVKQVLYVENCEVDLNLIADKDGFVKFNELNQAAFFQKTKHWQDEEEYRLIRKISDLKKQSEGADIYLNNLPIETIVSIAFGALMSKEDKASIIKLCGGSRINLLQCVVYRDRPSNPIGFWSLDTDEMIAKVMKRKPRNFVMELSHFDEMLNPITLSSVAEIPYYRNNPKLIDSLFLRAKELIEKKTSDSL